MTAAAEREYARLLTKGPVRVLRTSRAYDAALGELCSLTSLGDGRSEAQDEYYELLATLVSDYDRRHVPPLPKVPPLEFLKEAMVLCEIGQAQIGHLLGRSAASAILNGKREISKAQARKLADLFTVDPGLFI